MAYNRKSTRERIVELLSEMELRPGKPLFAAVHNAQMKSQSGLSPTANVWNGPLWLSQRRTQDATVNTGAVRVGIYIARNDEEQAEDIMDNIANQIIQMVREHLQEDGYWYYLEFGEESYPDYPPIEEGTQYRREIFDLRAYYELGSL